MLIKQQILEQIAKGKVRLAFRRWQRLTVRAGGQLHTAIGILAIDAIGVVALDRSPMSTPSRPGHLTEGFLSPRSQAVLKRLDL